MASGIIPLGLEHSPLYGTGIAGTRLALPQEEHAGTEDGSIIDRIYRGTGVNEE
jgi:hypothetical protein